jgi:hypothetical protein
LYPGDVWAAAIPGASIANINPSNIAIAMYLFTIIRNPVEIGIVNQNGMSIFY